ncbi:ABC transporter ATP-binding protein, partial [Burkholderia contaminans]
MNASNETTAHAAAIGAGAVAAGPAAAADAADLVIEVRNLTKRYGRNIIHQKLDFDVRRGE